ncbi:MAG: nitrite reductase small subunit NirD [Mycobacteriales bacterium]
MSGWQSVCRLEQLPTDRGVAALLQDQQVALFRLTDDALHAVGNRDPFSGAMVMSRGIVGSRGEVPVVVNPMYKQAFDLRTGQCLDDPEVTIASYPIRVHDGMVQVAVSYAERQPA